MALSLSGRALHFVFKIADRQASVKFYTEILGMKVLRHEEFAEGCEATCNGGYEGRWSKTMVGYGPESQNFAIELTYNYGVKYYEPGNDFLGITITSGEAIKRAKEQNLPMEIIDNTFMIKAPGGYKYYLIDQPQPQLQPNNQNDPIEKVSLASSNLEKTIQYWNKTLGLKITEKKDKSVCFAFNERQCLLEFKDIGVPINHAKAFGRIAFSVPKNSLEGIQKKIESEKQQILTPLIALDTPDKATVYVVILADPDQHEICFVDDEGFRELSEFDPESETLLKKFIRCDKS